MSIEDTETKEKYALIDLTFYTNDLTKHPRLEAEIDKMVYALYNLIPEDIAIVEGKG